MKEAWPVEAKGTGGRHYRNHYVDQNLTTTRSNTPLKTAPRCCSMAERILVAIKSRQLYPWHQGFRRGFNRVPHPGQMQDLQGPEDGQERLVLAVPPDEPIPIN